VHTAGKTVLGARKSPRNPASQVLRIKSIVGRVDSVYLGSPLVEACRLRSPMV